MGSVVIKIRPDQLKNPDADLRYVIPDRLIELTSNRLSDDGYDYLEDEYTTMAIFLKSEHPQEDAAKILEIFKTEIFLENNIYDTSIIAVCDINDCDLDEYTTIHPQ